MAQSPLRAKQELLSRVRAEEKKAVREAALKSTWVMATMVLWPDMAERHYWEPAHRPLCDWMDNTPQGGKRAAIFHRQARKTMLLTIARCVRLICAYPEIRIMLISALQRTSTDMCGLIKRQFQTNQSFRYYFSDFAISDPKFGKMDEFTVPWRTVTSFLDPTLFCTYTGSAMISRRCDVLVFDDPVDDDDVNNPDMAAATMRNFIKCIPLVDDTSAFRQTTFVGTFKSHNDPASAICGYLSDTDAKKSKVDEIGDWEVVFRPISFTPEGDFHKPGAFAFPDENPSAKPHLPNVHSPERIRAIFNECCKDPYLGESYFYREYACLVQAPQDQKFQAMWLNTWVEPAMVPPNTIFSGFTIDSAFKDAQITKARGDTTVCLVGHYDVHNNLYLTDGLRGRMDSDTFRKQLLAMLNHPKNRQAQNLIKEKVGEGTIFSEFKRWFTEARKPVVVHPLPVIGRGEKVIRIINALQGPLMGRKIFFVKGQFPEELHRVIVDELTHLGQWGHDDAADALALFFHPDIRPTLAGYSKTVVWKDVVTVPQQISTPWTNPMAIRQANPQAPQQDPKSGRLTPFGQSVGLDTGTFMSQGEGPKEMPAFEWQPIIQKIGV